MFLTQDIFLYLQFNICAFCSDLWETLNIVKSSFDVCKESTRKTVKVEIKEASLRISLKNINSGATFQIKLQFKDVLVFPFDLQFNVFFSEISWNREHSEVAVYIWSAKTLHLQIWENSQENACPGVSLLKKSQASCNFLKKRLQHRCFPVNFAKLLRVNFLQNTSTWLLPNINSKLWRF